VQRSLIFYSINWAEVASLSYFLSSHCAELPHLLSSILSTKQRSPTSLIRHPLYCASPIFRPLYWVEVVSLHYLMFSIKGFFHAIKESLYCSRPNRQVRRHICTKTKHSNIYFRLYLLDTPLLHMPPFIATVSQEAGIEPRTVCIDSPSC
jgi:hypothetical protein